MNMRYLFLAIAVLFTMSAVAQETYENTKLIDNDLNGTARYVGMGGAMDALGSDISTISTNPAGIGLFRRSMANLSFGLISQQGVKNFTSGHKNNASFDQIGFVYALRNGRNSFLNFAFNYHKSRNFDQILSASGVLSNASQNKLTTTKARLGIFKSNKDATYNQLDHLYMNNLVQQTNAAGGKTFGYYPATGYTFDQAVKGYIGEYDFNVSGNIQDRIYLGMTVGIHDVHYKHYGEYQEVFVPNKENIQGVRIADNREITGTGVDLKLGAIFRPIEGSPFRVGLSITTPTWYDLTTSNSTTVDTGKKSQRIGESYDFKIFTPWRFGVSAGHTVGNWFALGASYEYADYGTTDIRINDGGYYDSWYGQYYESSSSDKAMNDHTKRVLKGVSILKLGLEYKPLSDFAVRMGYNYVSPMFDRDGFKDGSISSAGTFYASQTAYTNWQSTNRFTCGFGYMIGKYNFDFAYQFSATKGDFYPFMSYYDNSNPKENNIVDAVRVNNKRHQLLFTLGYKF